MRNPQSSHFFAIFLAVIRRMAWDPTDPPRLAVHPAHLPSPMTAFIQLAQFHHSRVEATAILRSRKVGHFLPKMLAKVTFEDDFIREVWGGSKNLQIFARSMVMNSSSHWKNLLRHTRHPQRFDMERFLFTVASVGFIFISRSGLFSNTRWSLA